jgi:hypothetical protein
LERGVDLGSRSSGVASAICSRASVSASRNLAIEAYAVRKLSKWLSRISSAEDGLTSALLHIRHLPLQFGDAPVRIDERQWVRRSSKPNPAEAKRAFIPYATRPIAAPPTLGDIFGRGGQQVAIGAGPPPRRIGFRAWAATRQTKRYTPAQKQLRYIFQTVAAHLGSTICARKSPATFASGGQGTRCTPTPHRYRIWLMRGLSAQI